MQTSSASIQARNCTHTALTRTLEFEEWRPIPIHYPDWNPGSHSLCYLQNKLWLIDSTGSRVLCYDLGTTLCHSSPLTQFQKAAKESWVQATLQPPCQFGSDHAAVVTDEEIIIVGGKRISHDITVFRIPWEPTASLVSACLRHVAMNFDQYERRLHTLPLDLVERIRAVKRDVQAQSPAPMDSSEEDEHWECQACTFLNSGDNSSCDMCDTLRNT